MTKNANSENKFEEMKHQNSIVNKVAFTSNLINEIYKSLFSSNKALIELTGDDVNYETMLQVQSVGRFFTEQGAIVLMQFDSKKSTIAVRV